MKKITEQPNLSNTGEYVKTVKMLLLLVAFVLTIAACKKDKDKPQTVPAVETLTAVSSGTTTATVTGKVSNDGNATITEAGFVYSSNVNLPTTADNKKTITDFNTFQAELAGLSSGTTYHVRAYATNSTGTGYGEVINFTTGNAGPVASELSIEGTLAVGNTITAKYKYSDAENDAEEASTFQWYVANDANGAGEAVITGANSKTFLIQDAQNGKFLRFSVTPKATAGTASGAEIKSGFSAGIGAETVTFNYNGVSVTYGTIISSTTQRKWLDRNLGAARVAQTVDDYTAYGHYFQWGRSADGHQVVMRSGATDENVTATNGTTTIKSPNVTAPDNKFVIDSDFGTTGDWLGAQNDNLWQGNNGVNNPCPAGWRLPTKDEWTAENITSLTNGFDKLKLTYTGYRGVEDANFWDSNTMGSYWTSSVGAADGIKKSFRVRLNATFFSGMVVRGNAYACRCIKN